jgi:DNA (cytosine-5)-methyltransferase 1
VLLENVTGFLTSRAGDDFRAALLELNHLGYTVDPFIIDASHFVPQSRQRLFVVAELQSKEKASAIGEKKRRSAAFFESEIRPRALAEFIFSNPAINWRLRDLSPLPKSHRRLTSILENLPDDAPEWWNKKRTTYLLNQMSQRHRIIADKMINSAGWSFGTVFRRVREGGSMAELRVDGIAGCLRTPRGGRGRQILVKAGFGEFCARLLTPRECARLMGADDFVISGSLNQALFGFGDAVCVPVIEWIAENYLNHALEGYEALDDRFEHLAYA